jgi:DNA-binding NarL/FixJ family response regulator
MTIRVLIADDQDLVREGVRMMLDAEPDIDVVGMAGTGAEAVVGVGQTRPDVVLMDIRMPDVDGIQATERLAAGGSDAKVLVLTTFDLDEYVYRAMRAGASGFVLKDATREQLTDAVRRVARGDSLVAPAVLRRLVETFCRTPPRSMALAGSSLTEREVDILRCVARGLSNAEIAAELYLAEATVKGYVARILAKLGLRDRIQVVVHAYEHGIVTPGDATR